MKSAVEAADVLVWLPPLAPELTDRLYREPVIAGRDLRVTAFENAIHPVYGSVVFAVWLDELARGKLNWGERLLRMMPPGIGPADCDSLLLGAVLYEWITPASWSPTAQQQRTGVPGGGAAANPWCLDQYSFRPGVCTPLDCWMPREALVFIETMRPRFELLVAPRMPPRKAAAP